MALLSDEDIFGKTPEKPALLSDEDVFGKPGFLDYAKELVTSIPEGIKGFAAQALRGSAAVPPMPPIPGESEAEFHLRREEFDAQPRVPTVENPLYKAGESLDQFGKSVLGASPGWEGSLTRDIGGGIGSVVSVIGLSLLNPAAASLASVAAGQGEAAQRAIQGGASEEQIRRAAYLGSGAGATDLVDALIPHIGGARAAAAFIRRVGAPVVAAALAESGQEGVQGLIQNAIAKGIYKPEQDLGEGIPRQMLVGGIVGGGFKAGQIGLGMQGSSQPEATPEEIAIARATLTAPSPAPGAKAPMGLDELQTLMGSMGIPTPAVAPIPTTVSGTEPVAVTLTDEEVFAPAGPPASVPDRYAGVVPPLSDIDSTMLPIQPPAPLEGDILPPLKPVVDPNQVPANIVEFVHRNEKSLEVPKETMGFSDLIDANASLKQDIVGQVGMNTGRIAKFLSSSQYGTPKDLTKVSVKEMFQNSFDAIKDVIFDSPKFRGWIDIKTDYSNRTITVTDNGVGISPEVLGNEFLQIGGTKKKSDRASGGFGIAKMMILFENKRMNVVSARDGKISTMVTTGEELYRALNKESPGPAISVRKMEKADYVIFPQGHGTRIEVEIPKSYVDPSTSEDTEIGFDGYLSDWSAPVLKRSPLFDNIEVTYNDQVLPLGNAFPIQDYTQFFNVSFGWGTARVYVSQAPVEGYSDNVHVLSNGLWQFSMDLPKDPQKPYGGLIPRQIFVDLNAKVDPSAVGYPFAGNRQEFSPAVRKDFAQLFLHIQLSYMQQEANVSVENFGTMQFLNFDDLSKTVKATGERKLQPPERPKTAADTGIVGQNVSIVDGKLIVEGREIEELDPKTLGQNKIDVSKLKIPQSEIDPNSIILHDNTLVPATGAPLDQMAMQPLDFGSIDPMEQQPWVDPDAAPDSIVDDGMPKIPLSQLAADKFGGRFYEYVYLMGAQFRELRNVIADFDVKEPNYSEKRYGVKNYSKLKEIGIGVSFDVEYRGVYIHIPFEATFLNVAIPVDASTPATAAVGMITTMVHELGHHVHKSEEGLMPVGQDLFTQLDLHPTFNFHKFKQRAIDVVAHYNDVFQFLNGAYQSGIVTTGGKRLKNVGQQSTGDGGVPGNLGEPSSREAGGHRLSDWRALGQSTSGSGRGRPDAGASVAGTGTGGRDPSFGKNANQRALNQEADPLTGRREPGSGPGPDATQQQPELGPSRQAIRSVFGGSTPTAVAAMSAHADRMNWFYKWMAGLTQLTDANPDFVPLVTYTETTRMMHSDEARIHDAAVRIGKDWRNLGSQGDNLSAFLHDLTRMVYLTPQEAAANVERQPSRAEFDLLVDKHKMSGPALKTFAKVKALFDLFIDQVIAVQIEKGVRGMTDPVRIAAKMDQIRTAGLKLKDKPYFPFMNFGRHFVQVKNAAGDIVEFYTFERSGVWSAERMQQSAMRKLEAEVARRGLGETVKDGIIPEAADPFIGMPPQLLEAIKTNLGLTQLQLDALDQMRAQSTSSTSFKNRFSNRTVLPGYSMDFKRAFAKYFFHGARYYARTKYVPQLKDQINFAQEAGGNKASKISEYMSDHLQNTVLDAKGDFGLFKGAIFVWAMGYVPMAAWQNLSQTPMITYPFLAHKFGDFSTGVALTRAFANINSFYKKGTYEGMVNAGTANFELKAIDYGIKTGRISETQSADLAGLAQGEGLIKGIAGNRASQMAVVVQEKAAWMFEMAEQLNRRVAFRAGLYLGQTKPGAKEVQVALKKYAQEFLELQTKGFTAAEAKAIITAIHVTDQTQFVYARYARSRLFRGKKGIIFVFKQYMQSVLFLFGQNKGMLPRAALIWLFLGGLASFPGWDDLKEIIKGVARWKFGRDFDIEKELRKYIMDYTGSEAGADLALHGFARKGFGVPALLDLMGSLYTGKPGRGLTSNTPGVNVSAPVIDMSRAISMGNVLPAEVGKMINPDKTSTVIGEQTQRASGAVFSVGFNLYKAMWDQRDIFDPKRWEKAVPRALAMTSRAFRAYDEQRERTNLGGPNSAATIVNYNVRDTEHLMEILAIAGGFQTERVSTRWDRIMSQVEAEKFYEMRKKALLSQLFEAKKGGIPQEQDDVVSLIQQFNDGIPEYARGYKITGETAKRSMQARERELGNREAGVPSKKAARPISEYLDSLYPSVPVDMRRAR